MKVLFFDIESTALNGDWGRMLCVSFAELGGEVYTYRKDVKPFKGRSVIDDSRLAKATKKELMDADIIVGWNSIRFDVPLINSRLAAAGELPINIGEKYGSSHLDLMYYAGGNSMALGSRRLDNVAKYFGTDNQKTKLDGEIWQLAAAGDENAMDEIVEHCEADVMVTQELFPHLAPHVKKHTFNMSEVWPFINQIPSRKAK